MPRARVSSCSRSSTHAKNPSASRSCTRLRSADARAVQALPDEALLAGVVQPDHPDSHPARPEPLEVPADVGHPACGRDQDALLGQVAPQPGREGEHRDLVAGALDEHDGPVHLGDDSAPIHSRVDNWTMLGA